MKQQISSGTVARTILLALALINQLLTVTGHNPIPYDSQELEMFVSTLFTAVASLIAWWKNNSFTQKAIAADKVKDGIISIH